MAQSATKSTTANLVSDDQRFAFEAAGYLHLRGVVPRAEIDEVVSWATAIEATDNNTFNVDRPETLTKLLNRPVSRPIDVDQRFLRYLDDARIHPYLHDFLGDYRHIDNDLYYTSPGFVGGKWHRGVDALPDAEHLRHGVFGCPMVKIFWCLTDVGRGQGEFVVVPGSHRSQLAIDILRIDLPGQHVFDNVRAGDVIIFNEALLHNGRPNVSTHTRKTLIFNYGRNSVGTWAGYRPSSATLAAASVAQRRILANADILWQPPVITWP